MGFPLLSQFLGLRSDPPRPSIRAGQGLQPLSPTEAPGAHGEWTQCHREQGGIQRVAAGATALRGHRELCPTMGQPGDTGRDLNTFTRDREEWKEQMGLGRAHPRM